MQPIVTAIIPTYNRAEIVGRAIDSVLAQTYPNIQLVVVDDGSTDATRAVLAGYGDRIEPIFQQNAGVGHARNAGIAAARGEFIAFLDSDDTWDAWKIAAQVQAFQTFPELSVVYTDARSIDLDGQQVFASSLRSFHRKALSYLDGIDILPRAETMECATEGGAVRALPVRIGHLGAYLWLGTLLLIQTTMIRAEALRARGLLDPAVGNAGEDYEFFSRQTENCLTALIDTPATTCLNGRDDKLSRMRTHTALQNLATMHKIVARRGVPRSLPPAVISARWRDAYAWAGEALFDEGREREARRYLWQALRHGDRRPRLLACLLLTYLGSGVTEGLRRVYQALKTA